MEKFTRIVGSARPLPAENVTAVASEIDTGALVAALTQEPASTATVGLESESIAGGEWRCRFSVAPTPNPPAERLGRFRSHEFIPRADRPFGAADVQIRRVGAYRAGH